MIVRHFSAYKFAKDYLYNRNILDIGCGEGYGSYYLAGFTKNIMGIDYDKAVIDYAKTKYQKNNLQFYVMDIKNIGSLKEKFSGICSFQFIEHILDTKSLLSNIRNLLDADGIFICSTPNRKDASPATDKPLNKFHVKEYLWNEFAELLKIYFEKVEIFGLRRGRKLNFYRRLKKIGIFDFLPTSINPVKRFYDRIDCADFVIVKDKLDAALDFIAVCRK